MKLFGSPGLRVATQTIDRSPWSDYWYESRGETSIAGQRVNEESAMRVAAFLHGVRFISQLMGTLPLNVYERLTGGGKDKRADLHLHTVLHDRPNAWQSAQEWREMTTAHALVCGNGYSKIIPGRRGFVDELRPMNPRLVTPSLSDDWNLRYLVENSSGTEKKTLLKEEVFHLKGFGYGLSGISLLAAMRDTLGLALAMEMSGARFFAAGTTPSGVLQHPGILSEPAQDRLRKATALRHSGADKHWGIMVLEEGMTWQQIGISYKDSQFLEGRNFQIQEMARFLGLPPHVLYDLTRSTNNNIEHQGLELVMFSLMPWAKRWESSIQRDLIFEEDAGTFFAEFNMDALLRGDTLTRFQAYQLAIMNGIYSPNEVRDFENRNPRAGGDVYYSPQNLAPSGELPAGNTPKPPTGAPPDEASEDDEETKARRAVSAEKVAASLAEMEEFRLQLRGQVMGLRGKVEGIARAAADRLVRKEIAQIVRWSGRHASDSKAWGEWVEKFYSEHGALVAQSLAVSGKVAGPYCAARKELLLTSGVKVVETWKETSVEELVQIAMGEAA
jgi:HK97 family phage portal protein